MTPARQFGLRLVLAVEAAVLLLLVLACLVEDPAQAGARRERPAAGPALPASLGPTCQPLMLLSPDAAPLPGMRPVYRLTAGGDVVEELPPRRGFWARLGDRPALRLPAPMVELNAVQRGSLLAVLMRHSRQRPLPPGAVQPAGGTADSDEWRYLHLWLATLP